MTLWSSLLFLVVGSQPFMMQVKFTRVFEPF